MSHLVSLHIWVTLHDLYLRVIIKTEKQKENQIVSNCQNFSRNALFRDCYLPKGEIRENQICKRKLKILLCKFPLRLPTECQKC